MATIDIKDAKGEKTGTAELNPSVFGIEPNVPVMRLGGPRAASVAPGHA